MSEIVVVKLVSGEQLMGFLNEETKSGISIENPISIKVINVPTSKGIVEKTVTGPFCNMTDDTLFDFEWNHIMFVKPLHPAIVPLYLEIVDAENDIDSTEDIDESIEDHMFNTDKKILH